MNADKVYKSAPDLTDNVRIVANLFYPECPLMAKSEKSKTFTTEDTESTEEKLNIVNSAAALLTIKTLCPPCSLW
jgi:hypothetical protein